MELADVYERLLQRYGRQHWWPGAGGFETVAGAILTQHASWWNAERALNNLRAAGALTPAAIAIIHDAALVDLVRPAGCFRAKARTLRSFCQMLQSRFGGSLDSCLSRPLPEVRSALLNTRGIGPETADAILLYAGGHPTFVVDAYSRRILSRLGLSPAGSSYEDWRSFVMSTLPAQAGLYNEFHALLVRHGKETCLTTPRCGRCPFQSHCGFVPAAGDAGHATRFGGAT